MPQDSTNTTNCIELLQTHRKQLSVEVGQRNWMACLLNVTKYLKATHRRLLANRNGKSPWRLHSSINMTANWIGIRSNFSIYFPKTGRSRRLCFILSMCHNSCHRHVGADMLAVSVINISTAYPCPRSSSRGHCDDVRHIAGTGCDQICRRCASDNFLRSQLLLDRSLRVPSRPAASCNSSRRGERKLAC